MNNILKIGIAVVAGVAVYSLFFKSNGNAKILSQRATANHVHAVLRNVGGSADIQVFVRQDGREFCHSSFYFSSGEQREIQLLCPEVQDGRYSLVTYGGPKGIFN